LFDFLGNVIIYNSRKQRDRHSFSQQTYNIQYSKKYLVPSLHRLDWLHITTHYNKKNSPQNQSSSMLVIITATKYLFITTHFHFYVTANF